MGAMEVEVFKEIYKANLKKVLRCSSGVSEIASKLDLFADLVTTAQKICIKLSDMKMFRKNFMIMPVSAIYIACRELRRFCVLDEIMKAANLSIEAKSYVYDIVRRFSRPVDAELYVRGLGAKLGLSENVVERAVEILKKEKMQIKPQVAAATAVVIAMIENGMRVKYAPLGRLLGISPQIISLHVRKFLTKTKRTSE